MPFSHGYGQDRLRTENSRLKKRLEKLDFAFKRMAERARHYKKTAGELLNLAKFLMAIVKKLKSPPNEYAIFVRPHPNGKADEADVLLRGGFMKVLVAIDGMTAKDLKCGWEVLVSSGGGAIISVTKANWHWGNEVAFQKRLSEDLALVSNNDTQRMEQCYLSPELANAELQKGDCLLNCGGLLVRTLPHTEESQHFRDLEEISHYDWSKVGGLSGVIKTIHREIVPFRDPKAYREKFEGTELDKGMVFYGPPGCGKTLSAKCVAAELARSKGMKCYFISLAGADLSDKWVGETSKKIRALFEQAKEKVKEGALVVIFFDEMDSLFRRRDTSMEHEPWMAEHVGQFNKILDGVDPIRNILVVGATNQKDLVDAAILRRGRLGIHIEIKRPKTHKDVAQILRIYLSVTLPFAEQYFVDEYEYLDRFGDGEKKTIQLNRDPEKIREHFIDTIVARLLYVGEPVEVTLREEGEDETSVIDNKVVLETHRGLREMYLKDNLSGAALAGIVETAKKTAYARYVDQKEKAIRENPELWELRDQLNRLVGEEKAAERADKEKELEEALKKFGVKPEIKKRDFFKAIDEELDRLRHSERVSKKRSKPMGF